MRIYGHVGLAGSSRPAQGGRLARARRTLGDVEPEVGQVIVVDKRRWRIADHSTYRNDEGYEVTEWECEREDGEETAYLLSEADREPRWFFTRPIPLSTVTISGGKPFADVAATLKDPPDALVHKKLAYGFDEATEGSYAEDPGDTVGKTTWDYWDAKHRTNLAVERWADGRVECYLGRRIDPSSITVAGAAASDASAPGATAALGASGFVATGEVNRAGLKGMVVVATFAFVITMILTAVVETALTLTLGAVTVIGVLAYAQHVARPLSFVWPVTAVVLALGFTRFPPLTSVPGFALLVVVPAALTRWATTRDPGGSGAVGCAALGVGVAAAAAGLATYYRYAPGPRSIGQYVLAVGPGPLAGLVAALVAALVIRMSRR